MSVDRAIGDGTEQHEEPAAALETENRGVHNSNATSEVFKKEIKEGSFYWCCY